MLLVRIVSSKIYANLLIWHQIFEPIWVVLMEENVDDHNLDRLDSLHLYVNIVIHWAFASMKMVIVENHSMEFFDDYSIHDDDDYLMAVYDVDSFDIPNQQEWQNQILPIETNR